MCTGLTYLNISRCERVGEYGDRALIQLGRSCHQLKGLDAFGCSHAQVTHYLLASQNSDTTVAPGSIFRIDLETIASYPGGPSPSVLRLRPL